MFVFSEICVGEKGASRWVGGEDCVSFSHKEESFRLGKHSVRMEESLELHKTRSCYVSIKSEVETVFNEDIVGKQW